MNADAVGDGEFDEDDDFEDEGTDDEAGEADALVDDDATDNIGDASVEINVEQLISELESNGLVTDCMREHQTKRRLEEILEKRWAKKALEDFDDYEL